MIFIDASVAMYLVGAPHRLKTDAQLLLERHVAAGDRMATDVAVLQEILDRYTAIGCSEAIEPAFDAILGVVDEVLPVEEVDVIRAKEMAYGPERLGARPCLHLAVMERHGITRVMSYDTAFDRYSEISRLGAA